MCMLYSTESKACFGRSNKSSVKNISGMASKLAPNIKDTFWVFQYRSTLKQKCCSAVYGVWELELDSFGVYLYI